MTLPRSSLSTAVEMLIGIRSPSALTMYADLPMTGRPVFSVFCSAHSAPHRLDLNTSAQGRPIASLRDTPVIFSAARLNEVTRHPSSTVNTPSEMLSKIASVAVGIFVSGLCFFRLIGTLSHIGTRLRNTQHALSSTFKITRKKLNDVRHAVDLLYS